MIADTGTSLWVCTNVGFQFIVSGFTDFFHFSKMDLNDCRYGNVARIGPLYPLPFQLNHKQKHLFLFNSELKSN